MEKGAKIMEKKRRGGENEKTNDALHTLSLERKRGGKLGWWPQVTPAGTRIKAVEGLVGNRGRIQRLTSGKKDSD